MQRAGRVSLARLLFRLAPRNNVPTIGTTALREEGFSGELTLIGDEPYEAYDPELENRSAAPCSGNGQENHGPTA